MSARLDHSAAWLSRLDVAGADALPVAVMPHIQRMAAGSGGKFWTCDIVAAALRGTMQVWTIRIGADLRAVFVTEIVIYPRRKALRFIGCVGRGWRDWAFLRDAVRQFAASEGCDLMQLFAPSKWGLAFPDYRMGHVMFERDV